MKVCFVELTSFELLIQQLFAINLKCAVKCKKKKNYSAIYD